jgi:D-3-phosphoglycerate dehydrogenase
VSSLKQVLVAFWDVGYRFHQEGLDLLRSHGIDFELNPHQRIPTEDELVDLLAGKAGVVAYLEPYTSRVIDSATDLKVIGRLGVGYDSVDLDAARRKGIKVTWTPIPEFAKGMADATFGLVLAVTRKTPHVASLARSGEWRGAKLIPEIADLYGKTLGIVGMGRIGYEVARRARGFEMHVVYHDIRPNPEANALGARQLPFKEVLEQADVVSLHAPLAGDTYHLLGEEEFSLMKRDAFLINTARGALVDEDALYDALRNGELAGAAMDVLSQEPPPPDHALLSLPNVIITPHVGPGRETYRALTLAAVQNVIDVLEGRDAQYTLA